MKRNIAIVAGGDTSEIVVSLRSAQGIYSFIDKEKYNLCGKLVNDALRGTFLRKTIKANCLRFRLNIHFFYFHYTHRSSSFFLIFREITRILSKYEFNSYDFFQNFFC